MNSEEVTYGWLEWLQVIYGQAGRPTYRYLARKIGVSHTHIGNILQGRAVPSSEVLFKLTEALTQNEKVRESIAVDFQTTHPDAYEQLRRPDRVSATADARLIADAINNLADAIRSLRHH